jgi:Tfp pilus assembly protein PilV
VEVVGAIGFLSVGLVALAGSLISMSHQREQSVARSLVMAGAQALLEEIKSSTNPRDIALTFDKAKYKVNGVSGADGGNALRVSVDTTNPKLITVRLNGTWTAAGHTETLELVSQIYSYGGQKS